jgi:hypothetical protein
MKKAIKIRTVGLCLIFFATGMKAQNNPKNPTFTFNNGIGVIAPDSLFSLNFRFRTQLRAAYTSVDSDNLSAAEVEARVRRLRLRFEGFLLNPKFNYYIQLSFSRADMDWNDNDNSIYNSSPNIVRDAVISYRFNKNFSVLFGQTKLPGNRQRVISSGELQFADRSIANATFNIDRDFGAQFVYRNQLSGLTYLLKGAITSGEGRNSTASNAGLAYTGRIELLPFGEFTNNGDYFEGDLEREKTLKASIAAVYHYNESAVRTAGTLGRDLYENRNLSSFIADFLIKYNGFALSAEYLNRNTDNPVTVNSVGDERIVYTGDGKMVQLSYLFKNNMELSGRYSIVSPNSKIEQKELQREEMGLGITKYLRKHRIKVQGHVFYLKGTDIYEDFVKTEGWNAMFQVELGI